MTSSSSLPSRTRGRHPQPHRHEFFYSRELLVCVHTAGAQPRLLFVSSHVACLRPPEQLVDPLPGREREDRHHVRFGRPDQDVLLQTAYGRGARRAPKPAVVRGASGVRGQGQGQARGNFVAGGLVMALVRASRQLGSGLEQGTAGVHDVEMVYLGLACRPVAAERGVDGGVDPFGEGPGACLLGFPDVDVTQLAAELADT